MILHINAKCYDLFAAHLTNEQGEQMGHNYRGYVPEFMPGDHYGDYVELDIDTKTGQILNWQQPTRSALARVFGPLKTKEVER